MPVEPLERDPVVTIPNDEPPTAPAKPARVGTSALLEEIRSLPEKVAAAVGGAGKGTASGVAEVTFVGEPPPLPEDPPPSPGDAGPDVPPGPKPEPTRLQRGYRFPTGRRRASLPS
jgi:hypothetical protein